MTSAKEAALRAAVLKALSKKVGAAEKAAKSIVQEELDPGDRKGAVLDDGTDIGTVSYTKGTAAKPLVADEREFTEWVLDHAPTEVIQTVRPAYRDSLLKRLQAADDNELVDPATGEIVPGVLQGSGGAPYVMVKQTTDQEQALAAAWVDGRLAGVLSLILDELEPGKEDD